MRLNLKGWVMALAAISASSLVARADTVTYNLSGPKVSGVVTVSTQPDPNTGPLPGTVPNTVDPIGAYIITGVSGVFTDLNANIFDAKITGLAPLNPVSPEPGNTYAPSRFSLFTVKNGVQGGGVPSPGLHFDNLFYPGGSPQTAFDYPLHGGLLDIYGLLFILDTGATVNLWSNGSPDGSGAGAPYGIAVATPLDVLDYTGGVSLSPTPEPASWAMMILGLGAIGLALRRRQVGRREA